MSKIKAIKTNFNAGEITKQLYGRVDLEAYQAANKQLINCLPTIYGSVQKRGGSVFVMDSSTAIVVRAAWAAAREAVAGATKILNIQHVSNLKIATQRYNPTNIDIDDGWFIAVQSTTGGSALFLDANLNVVYTLTLNYSLETIDSPITGAFIGRMIEDPGCFVYFTREDAIDLIHQWHYDSNNQYSYHEGDYGHFGYFTGDSWEDFFGNRITANPIMCVLDEKHTIGAWDGANFLRIRSASQDSGGGYVVSTVGATGATVNKKLFSCGGKVFCFAQSATESYLWIGDCGNTSYTTAISFARLDIFEHLELVKNIVYKNNAYIIITSFTDTDGITHIFRYKSTDLTNWTRNEIYSFDTNNNMGDFTYFNYNDKEALIGENYSVLRKSDNDEWFTTENISIDDDVIAQTDNEDKTYIVSNNNTGQIKIIEDYETGATTDNYDKSILIPFKINKNINYILEFGNKRVRFYRNRKVLLNTDKNVYEVVTPYDTNDIISSDGKNSIKYTQNGDFLYLCVEGFPVYVLKRYGDTNWIMEELKTTKGPWDDINSDETINLATAGAKEGVITVNATTPSATCYMKVVYGPTRYTSQSLITTNIKWEIDGATVVSQNVSNNEATVAKAIALLAATSHGDNLDITVDGNNITFKEKSASSISYANKVITLTIQKNPEYYASMWYYEYVGASKKFGAAGAANVFNSTDVGRLLKMYYDGSNVAPWEVSKSISAGDIRKSGNNYYKATTSGTTGSVKPIHTNGIESDGAVSWQYLHSGYGIGEIIAYTSASQVTVNVDGYFPDFSSGTSLWCLGLIGKDGAYPNCCTFFKERFVLAISTSNGTKICASVAGDYNNFADESFGEILAENAITVQLTGKQESKVLWMIPKNKLIIGTECEEFMFGEQSLADVLGPENVSCYTISNLGSANIKPLEVLDENFFVSADEKQIVGLNYIAERESYRPVAISVFFEHLLRMGVRCWCYTNNPHKAIWFADTDGNLRVIAYDIDQKVVGAARYELDGTIESLCAIPAPDGSYDDVWAVIKRTINNQTVKYVEYFSWGLPVEKQDSNDKKQALGIFCDSAKVYEYDENTGSVDGLNHLEGKNINVIVDGKIQNKKTVTNGAITLDKPGKIIVAGLDMGEMLVETLHFNIGSALGTTQGATQRINKLTARVIDTCDLKAKATDGTQYDTIVEKESLTDGDFKISLPSDYSQNMTVSLKSDKPVNTCVLALIAEYGTNN